MGSQARLSAPELGRVKDAQPERVEAGSAVHLPLDQLEPDQDSGSGSFISLPLLDRSRYHRLLRGRFGDSRVVDRWNLKNFAKVSGSTGLRYVPLNTPLCLPAELLRWRDPDGKLS